MKRFLPLLFLFIFSTTLFAQTPELGRFIDSFVKKNNFNGTILIERNGRPFFQKSYGFANMEFNIPNTIETKYKIASITKLFTAVLIMQLAEEGRIELNKHIRDYLPDYKGEGGDKVTIRQLLTHTSGLPNTDTVSSVESALQNGLPMYQLPQTTDKLLKDYCSGKLVNEPGKEFDYNNADFIILGKIIEKISNKTYEQVLTEKILAPLKMKNSGIVYQQNIIPKLASTYFFREDLGRLMPDLPVYMENWYAAGAMYSPANDLLLFTNALFGDKLLKRQTLNQVFVSGPGEYGFGTWVYEDYEIKKKKYRIVKRPGQIMGAQSMLFHILEDGSTIIILSNAANTGLDAFTAKIAVRVIR